MEIMDHFSNPQNIGTLPHANGIGVSGSPQLGNYLQFFLYVEEGTVKEARYLIQGRPQAIAAASYVSTFVIGKHINEVLQLTTTQLRKIFRWPWGLYEPCLELVTEGVKNAILDYLSKA